MRRFLLKLIRCPDCKGSLSLQEGYIKDEIEIREGKLVCTNCFNIYSITKGIPQLLVSDENYAEIESEIMGWVELAKKEGWYYLPDECYLRLPYKVVDGVEAEFWKKEYLKKFHENVEMYNIRAEQFDYAIKSLNLAGGEKILDVGAGKCWSSRYFAERGCDVVAMDVLVDEHIGLGRAGTYFKNLNVYFERVCGDFESMPFRDGFFDIVFSSATLHHARNLPRLLGEFYRVLRNGGKVIVIDEPFRSIFSSERKTVKEDLIKAGLHEHVFTYPQYKSAFIEAGFKARFRTFLSIQNPGAQKKVLSEYKTIKAKLAKRLMDYALPRRIINKYSLIFGGGLLIIEGKKA